MTKTVSFSLAVKTIELPSYPGSQVLIKKISVGAQRKIQEKFKISADSAEDDDTTMKAGFEMLVAGIDSRNFCEEGTSEDEEPVMIVPTAEIIEQMPEEDVALLLYEITGFVTPKFKKND